MNFKSALRRLVVIGMALGMGLSCGPGNGSAPYRGSANLEVLAPLDGTFSTTETSGVAVELKAHVTNTETNALVPSIKVETIFAAIPDAGVPDPVIFMEGDGNVVFGTTGAALDIPSNFNGVAEAVIFIPAGWSGEITVYFNIPNSVDSTKLTINTVVTPECADSVDNDGDTLTDFGAGGDPGCSSATDTLETNSAIQCDDGIDNTDIDLFADAADPGCAGGPTDTSETSQCEDGVDNEAVPDALIDFPADPGCSDAGDNSE